MSKEPNVLIIGLNGSPHRAGNTVTLMGWVLDGCREGGAHVEWIHIADHDVHYCQGCFACLRTGRCPIPDDFAAVLNRLLAADGIVMGSPVYEGQPTAQLKTFLDRLSLLNLYTDTFAGHFSVGVATSGIAPTEEVARTATAFGRRVGTIGSRTTTLSLGYQPLAELHPPGLPVRARTLGRRLVRCILSRRTTHVLPLEYAWYALLRRLFIRPLVTRHPDQFAGVLRIWQERKGAPARAQAVD